MILQEKEIEVKNLGFENGSQMTIKEKNILKIYKLLTTSSYKDIESSIIREFCVNGLDSNVSAGKPNDPVFLKYNKETGSIHIIDNGLGMSEEFIRDNYMSMGESTKENIEDQVGGFGIGAKSLFAYNSYYYLNSRYNGVLSKYLLAESDTGLPDVTLLSTELTTECNGVEIIFDLKNSDDFEKYKIAAKNQLKYFKNIIIEGFGLDNDFKLYQGSNFVFRPDRVNTTGYLEISWGSVCYPINYTFLGINPIKVNCSIYFPQNTHLVPEAARENLRNTENNKKLILDKIEEFRTEITNLWNNEQEIDSFFDFCNKSKKTVTFEGNELDVSDIITESYIYKPLLNTGIDHKLFKKWGSSIYDSLFVHRKNSRFYSNGMNQIGINKKIYHSPKQVSSDKLSRNNWEAFIRPSDSSIEGQLEKFYPDVKWNWDNIVKDHVLTNPRNIDYKKDIEYIRECIWKEITEKTIDINSLTVKKDRTVTKLDTTEVRVKIPNENYSVYNVDYFKDYRYVVFTTSQEEFDELCDLDIRGYNNNGSKNRKSISKFFIPLLGAKKYEGKIPNAISYEEFLNSELLKKYYFRNVKRTLIYNTDVDQYVLRNYTYVHRMYDKYHYLKDYFDRYKGGSYYNLHHRMKNKLSEMYTTEIVEKEVNSNLEIYNKLHKISNLEVLKYKLLYTAQKKRVKALTKQLR